MLNNNIRKQILSFLAVVSMGIFGGCEGSRVGTDTKSKQAKSKSVLKPDADFAALVETIERLAAKASTTDATGHDFEVRVDDSNSEDGSIRIAVEDHSSRSVEISRCTILWVKQEDGWHVKNMTSDWEKYGLLSISAEQSVINSICREIDVDYVPPRATPEQDADGRKALEGLFP